MKTEEIELAIQQIKALAQYWNELYAAQKFDDMMYLATEDVGIANSAESSDPSGLIFGREAYKQGICGAYYGESGKEHNLLVMEYEGWEYISLSENRFYTIGRYSLQPNYVGVNCWLLRRESRHSDWKIFRVINT